MNYYELPVQTLTADESVHRILNEHEILTIHDLPDNEELMEEWNLPEETENALEEVISCLKTEGIAYIISCLIPEADDLEGFGLKPDTVSLLKKRGIWGMPDLLREGRICGLDRAEAENLQYVMDTCRIVFTRALHCVNDLYRRNLDRKAFAFVLNTLNITLKETPELDYAPFHEAGYTKAGDIFALSDEEIRALSDMDEDLYMDIMTSMDEFVQKNIIRIYAVIRDIDTDHNILNYIHQPQYIASIQMYVRHNPENRITVSKETEQAVCSVFPSIYHLITAEQKDINALLYKYGKEVYDAAMAERFAYLLAHEERMIRYITGDTDALYSDTAIGKLILDEYEEVPFGCFTLSFLHEQIPSLSKTKLEEIMHAMVKEKTLISKDNGTFERTYSLFDDMCERTASLTQQEKNCLKMKQSGRSIHAIAEEEKLSEEKVHEIIDHAYKAVQAENRERNGTEYFEEDRYRYLLSTYDIDVNDVVKYMQAPESLVPYYRLVNTSSFAKQIIYAHNDENLSEEMKEGIRTVIKNTKKNA